MKKIVAIQDDGAEVDVTEAVAITYDLLRNSLDWGSGFLDTQEMSHVIRLGEAAGYADIEDAIREAWAEWHDDANRRSGYQLQPPGRMSPAEKARSIAEFRKEVGV